ncbi:MAG: hypothetical protein QXV61_03895 [Archaeoglobaceae archaeon]
MLQFLLYASVLVFFSGVIYKFLKLLNRLHLRCDLYPIPHNSKPYGGSYYEEIDWWEKEMKKSSFGTLKSFLSIFLINRKKMSLQQRHWFATFLFHLGIFLHVLWIFILGIFVLFESISISMVVNLNWIFSFFGIIGMLLMFLLALYLTIRKLKAPIRYYVPPEDYIILIFVCIISASGILAFLEVDRNHVLEVLRSLILVSEVPTLSFFETIHILAFSLLILILPFTRITHYIAVWFAHLVIWDDRLADQLEPELGKILKSYRVKWNAKHLNPDLSWEEEMKWSGQ